MFEADSHQLDKGYRKPWQSSATARRQERPAGAAWYRRAQIGGWLVRLLARLKGNDCQPAGNTHGITESAQRHTASCHPFNPGSWVTRL